MTPGKAKLNWPNLGPRSSLFSECFQLNSHCAPIPLLSSATMVKFSESDPDSKRALSDVREESESAIDGEAPANGAGDESSKKKRKNKEKKDGKQRSLKKRRHSISRVARDPRDDPSPTATTSPGTRSPSPVIDFDGLSRPSMC